MVSTARSRPAGLAQAHVLRFPRTGVLCGWRPGCPGPRRRGGHRGVCTHGDLRALTLNGPERSRLWCITSQGLRYQRLVSGSPGGRLCCRCLLYSTPAKGGGRAARLARHLRSGSSSSEAWAAGGGSMALGKKAWSPGCVLEKAVGESSGFFPARIRLEGDHRLEPQAGN